MFLEQCAFQIWSWSIFDLQNSFRLWMVQDHKVLKKLLMVQDHMVLNHLSRPKSPRALHGSSCWAPPEYLIWSWTICRGQNLQRHYMVAHVEHRQNILKAIYCTVTPTYEPRGEGVLTLTWYMYMCLLLRCFFAKFGIAISGFHHRRRSPNDINWVYYEQLTVKRTIFCSNWMSFFYQKWYTNVGKN